MSKLFKTFCASLCAYSFTLSADAPEEFTPELPAVEIVQMPIEESKSTATPFVDTIEAPKPAALEPKAPPKKPKVQEVSVNPFTGKIKGKKVRMRLRPDLDSRIIKELSKNELVTVIGEKGDFWAVQAPAGTKGYIFRSFVLDNVVEGSHVNVRLEPSLDAPVIAHMNSGEKIESPSISPVNPKWLEIAPPEGTKFYIAKDFIEYAGGPEVKAQMDRRASNAEQILDAAALLSQAEMRKPFEEIDFDRVIRGFTTVIMDYADFPDLVEQSKEALATFQEAYLQKRIIHLDAQEEHVATTNVKADSEPATDKMRLWEPIEEALYLSWANIRDNKTLGDYYEEQRLAAVEIEGIVEPYIAPAKNKPGDYFLRDKDSPVGYLYSTQVNLQNLVGKKVRLVAAPRPNNNFAFPAYYVLRAE